MPDNAFIYDRPLTVERVKAAATEDDFGQVDLTDAATWETYWTGFCRVLSRGSREYFRVARLDATVTHVLVVRWSTETAAIIPQTMRIQFLGRTFHITSIENIDDQNREVQIGCTEFIAA